LTDLKKYEDALLSLDSMSFEEYIGKVMNHRRFTENDNNLVKDIKRRIRNRESARKSRRNKKTKIEVLQDKVNQLNGENLGLKQDVYGLKQDVCNLTQENINLKNEVVYWRELNNNKPKSPDNEMNSSAPGGLSTQSVILFVVLFSFGMLWNMDIASVVQNSFGKNYNNQYVNPMLNRFEEDPLLDKLFEENLFSSGDTYNSRSYRDHLKDNKGRKDVETCC